MTKGKEMAKNSVISFFGGGSSGSLIVKPGILDDQHCLATAEGGAPFEVGQVSSDRGYVHVLDDTTLSILLTTLDTISDFVTYLIKKEILVTSGRLYAATGEEELLALYLTNLNSQKEHDFGFESDATHVGVLEGFWKDFEKHPQRVAQIKANEISYLWDSLIEQFAKHARQGTSRLVTPPEFSTHDIALRMLAREGRTRRRILGQQLWESFQITLPNQRRVRHIAPSHKGDPAYVFLFLPVPQDVPNDDYRQVRLDHLKECCFMAKLLIPSANHFVGIAMESGKHKARSEDVVYLNASTFTHEDYEEAKRLRDFYQERGIIGPRTVQHRIVREYPNVPSSNLNTKKTRMHGTDRNKPCPCGSGKKHKRCCG